ncbi:MAG: pyruvate kinase [Bryobacteraceae bacterium]
MTRQHITSLIEELTQIRKACLSMEKEFAAEVDSAAEGYRASARNLLHYLGLRQHDIRRLQQDLWTLGLSSLARTEAHVLAGADAILVALHALAISDVPKGRQAQQPVTFETGPALLEQHTTLLLGPEPDHQTRVMVTMPTEAGDDYRLIRDLLAAGMDLMRISCAHDSPDAWRRMISNLEAAQHEVDRPCKVLMDLCGPELRTGELGGSSRLVHWKVRKNPRGEVIAPARIRVVAATGKPLEADATPELPVGAELLAAAKTGDYFQLELSPSQRRNLRVAHKNGSLCWAETGHSGYAEPGMPITLMRNGEGVIARGVVGEVPWLEEPVLVFRGEFLVVTGPSEAPSNERIGDGPSPIEARVPCTLPQVFQFVEKGHRILFDEGRIEGVVVEAGKDQLVVEVTRADRDGAKLRSGKSIHLPDTDLHLGALNGQDLSDLDFVAAHADMVGMSFVQGPQDLLDLQRELEKRGRTDAGIVLKIETRQAFDNLPSLLLTGLRRPGLGIMVARADLSVEMGFEQLADVQEEIELLCEAAHVPVIWATQVLETLSKKGHPTRSEISDATMSVHAECVMLNKGPHMVEAVHFLDEILRGMQQHRLKKRSLLHSLSVSELESLPVPAQVTPAND